MYNEIAIMLIAMFRTLFSDEYRTQLLVADLLDDDLAVASAAAEDLGDIGWQAAVPALLDMLAITAQDIHAEANRYRQREQVDLRQDIVRSLGKIGDERAVAPLIAVLHTDDDRGIQYEATDALLKIGTKPAVLAVQQWRHNHNAEI